MIQRAAGGALGGAILFGLLNDPRRTGGPHYHTDWQAAGVVDFWGTSFYPKHSYPTGRDPAWRGSLLDFSRSASDAKANGFYIGELQAGFGTIALRLSRAARRASSVEAPARSSCC